MSSPTHGTISSTRDEAVHARPEEAPPEPAHSLREAAASHNTLMGYVAMNNVDPDSPIGREAAHDQRDEHAEVEKLAYQFFLERGGEHGSHEEDWYRAEQQVRSKKHQESALGKD